MWRVSIDVSAFPKKGLLVRLKKKQATKVLLIHFLYEIKQYSLIRVKVNLHQIYKSNFWSMRKETNRDF